MSENVRGPIRLFLIYHNNCYWGYEGGAVVKQFKIFQNPLQIFHSNYRVDIIVRLKGKIKLNV